jgi:membrane protease YdiL (CAAX protease family)
MDSGIDLALASLRLALAMASLLVWLQILVLRRRRIPLAVAEPRASVPWNGTDVLFLAIAAFAFELAASALVASRPPAVPDAPQEAAAVAIVDPAAQQVSLANVVAVGISRMLWLSFALVLLSVRTQAPLYALGFDTSREPSDLRLAGILFLAAVLPVYGLQLLLNVVLKIESDHPLVTLVSERHSVGVLAIVTVVAVVVAPLAEEFLFRVLLQGWLEKRQVVRQGFAPGELAVPGYAPMVVSALFFGLLHLGHGADPIPLFVLGLFLGYAYRATHRIIAPLAMHMLVNSVAMVELWAIYFRGGAP